MTTYIALRDFPYARTEEDSQMAHWQSPRFDTMAEAVAALSEHMLAEAASWQKMAASGSTAMAEGALELARLAGVVQASSAAARLAGVRTRSGVVYKIRKL